MMLQITHVFDSELSTRALNSGINASAAIPCDSVLAGKQQIPKLLNLISDVQEIRASEQPMGGRHDYDSLLLLVQRKLESLSWDENLPGSCQSELSSPETKVAAPVTQDHEEFLGFYGPSVAEEEAKANWVTDLDEDMEGGSVWAEGLLASSSMQFTPELF